MKITIHRGLNQIGGCITEIQSLSGSKILIDLGHNLPDGNGTIEDKYEIPENLDKLLTGCSAVFYTHYHGDHLGFAAEVHKRAIPQYMGTLAIRMMVHLNKHMIFANELKPYAEANLKALNEFRIFQRNRKTTIGDITITPYNVDHSAPDSYMFLIECDGKKALHMGDYRDHGYFGKGLYSVLEKYIIPKGVDVLITEGTNIGQASKSVMPEHDLSEQLQQTMRTYKNVFVVCSSADVARLWSIHQAHFNIKLDRPLVCDKYQKEMIQLFVDEYKSGARYYKFCTKYIVDYRQDNIKLLDLMKYRGFTMLIRASGKFQNILNQVLPMCKPEDTCVVYSMFRGYIDPQHKAYIPDLHKFITQFAHFEYFHTSGHASKECLEKVCCMINPSVAIIPIHKEASFKDMNLPLGIKEKIYTDKVLMVV